MGFFGRRRATLEGCSRLLRKPKCFVSITTPGFPRSNLFFFFSLTSLSLSFVSFVLCLKQQKKHEEIDDHERQVFVGFAWFVSDALCVRRAGGGGGWRRRIQVARAHH